MYAFLCVHVCIYLQLSTIYIMLKRNEIARYNNSHHDIYAHPLNFLELIWWSENTCKIKANNLLFYASIYATK